MKFFQKTTPETTPESAAQPDAAQTPAGKSGKSGRKLRSRVALRHGTYATVITVLVLVAAIVLNVLSTALSQRFHTTVDLMAERSNTVSPANVEYIRKVDKDVSVTVCASEAGYTGDYMAYYASQFYMAEDATGQYYQQTITLLKDYAIYNNKIHVSFQDPQEPAFVDTQSRFPNTNLNYGDIIVECSFQTESGPMERNKILTFEDLYDLEDESGMAAYGMANYTVSGSKIETALTSAIYSVTSEKQVNALLIDRNTRVDTTSLVKNLELNNFSVTTTDASKLTAIPDGTDLLLLVAPGADFAPDEITVIENFLANGFDRGRGMVYIASGLSPQLPQLNAFLEEWGITIESGVLYETTEAYRTANGPTEMLLVNNMSDYTADINNKNVYYAAGNLLPMRTAYEAYQTRRTTTLMSTSSTVVAAPAGAGSDYTPDGNAVKSTYPVALLTTDTSYENDWENGKASYLVAFASDNFISSAWDEISMIGNMDFVVTAANQASGVNNVDISFNTKIVATGAFDTVADNKAVITARVIFVFLLPGAALVFCIAVWFRRKNK